MFTFPGTPDVLNLRRCTTGFGPRSSFPSTASRATWAEHARFALAHGVPKASLQRNGDLIRLAPDGPEKLTEVRVGRLVLDGDVILPADGTTVTERRRMSYSGLVTVALPVGPEGELAEAPIVRPSAFRSKKIATTSSPMRRTPRARV
jgi:ribonuclease J